MAANSDNCFRSKLLEDMLTCHICEDVYTTPKLLSCQHSFCEECLDKWVKASPTGQLSCPDCRKVFESFDGVENLPSNIFLGNLFDMVVNNSRKPEVDAKQQSCDVCNPGSTGKISENRCLDCDQYLCLNCSGMHHKLNVTKNHTLMSVDKYEMIRRTNPSIEKNSVYCDKHADSKVDIYCKTCDVAVCMNCAFEKHPNPIHQYMSLEMAAENEKERFAKLVQQLGNRKNELKEAKTHVEKQFGELSHSYKASLKSIKQHAEKIHRNIEAMEIKATESLGILFQGKRNLFESMKDTADKSIAAVSNTIEFVQIEIKSSSPWNFLLARDFLQVQIDDVLTLNVNNQDISGQLDFQLSGSTDVDEFVVPKMPVSIARPSLVDGFSEIRKKKDNMDGSIITNRSSKNSLPKDKSVSSKQTVYNSQTGIHSDHTVATAEVPKQTDVTRCQQKSDRKNSKPELSKSKWQKKIRPAKRQLPNNSTTNSSVPSTSGMSSGINNTKVMKKLHENVSVVHHLTGDPSSSNGKPSEK